MTKTVERPRSQWVRMVRDHVVAPVAVWYKRQRMIEELSGLSDRVLADIGLTRADIPMAVRQAYLPVSQPVLVAAEAVATAIEARPAASNDEAKQPLAA